MRSQSQLAAFKFLHWSIEREKKKKERREMTSPDKTFQKLPFLFQICFVPNLGEDKLSWPCTRRQISTVKHERSWRVFTQLLCAKCQHRIQVCCVEHMLHVPLWGKEWPSTRGSTWLWSWWRRLCRTRDTVTVTHSASSAGSTAFLKNKSCSLNSD